MPRITTLMHTHVDAPEFYSKVRTEDDRRFHASIIMLKKGTEKRIGKYKYPSALIKEQVDNIKNKIGGFFKALGYIVYVIFGLWGLIISVQIVGIVFGSQAAFLSLLIFPITFLVAPLYALIEWGNWFPLLIGYGGGFMGMVFVHIGDWIASPHVLTTEEIERTIKEAPPGDTQFEVGDRIIDPIGHKGIVEDIVEKDGKKIIGVIFENLFSDNTLKNQIVYLDPTVQKIRRIK